jgi:RNA polymerase sigma factor for flagellar operon FliA
VGSPDDAPEVLDRFHAELGLVSIVARQVGRSLGHRIELDELLSFGREGLLDAARKFDPDRGVPFRAYANFRVRGAILDGVRSQGRLPRRAHQRLRALEAGARASEGALEDLFAPLPPGSSSEDAERALDAHLATLATAMALGLVLNQPQDSEQEVADQSPTPEESVGRAELVSMVGEAVDQLPPPEDELIRRHYFQGERFDHVASELGLSKSWASRLHTRAVQRLAKRLRE